MTWLEEFSKKFLKKRSYSENFKVQEKQFYAHDPISTFVQTILTGYIKNYYYMDKNEIIQQSILLHNHTLKTDPEFYVKTLKIAREYGAMKDQVIIGLLNLSKFKYRNNYKDIIIDLISSFPPSQIVKKFIDTKRKTTLFGGLGRWEKRVLQTLLYKWQDNNKLLYYAVKYRKYVYDIVKLSHAYINKDIWNYVKNNYKEVNNEYLKKVIDLRKNIENYTNYSFNDIKLPFEIIRSNVPKEKWNIEWIVENTDITANTLVLQAVSLYEAGIDTNIISEKAYRSKTVTADKILKAMLVALNKGYNDLAESLAKAYAEKVKTTYKHLLLPIDTPKIAVVIDASGSMEPDSYQGYFINGISCVAPFSPIVKQLILFSNTANQHDPSLLSTYDGLLELKKIAETQYNYVTNISAGLKLVSDEINTIILVTDEQENVVCGNTASEEINKLTSSGKTVIVINPTPYPVHITNIKNDKIIYVPAPNPEATVGALRLNQLQKSNKDVKELVIELMKKNIKLE